MTANTCSRSADFSEIGWGSRSVSIGHDLSQDEWSSAIDTAIDSFEDHPYVLQEFHSGKLVHHPYLDPESGKIVDMEGRVRLCPYYFTPPPESATSISEVKLGGVLATICPADKKNSPRHERSNHGSLPRG